MGEIADMMLDGDMCEGCGEYLGDGDGYPTRCAACEEDSPTDRARREHHFVDVPPKPKKARPIRDTPCPICGRKLSSIGVKQHMIDKHGLTGGIVEMKEEIEQLKADKENLIQQAEQQAQEARTQATIVRECYDQTDTPRAGDWNGSKPVEALRAELDVALAKLERIKSECETCNGSGISEVLDGFDYETGGETYKDGTCPECQGTGIGWIGEIISQNKAMEPRVKQLDGILDVLRNSNRMGADKDEPEGARFIQISDTLAKQLVGDV